MSAIDFPLSPKKSERNELKTFPLGSRFHHQSGAHKLTQSCPGQNPENLISFMCDARVCRLDIDYFLMHDSSRLCEELTRRESEEGKKRL